MLILILLVGCGALSWSIILMINRKSKIPKDHDHLAKDHPSPEYISKNPLTKFESFNVWLICLLCPVIGGAILYSGWKKVLPIKAKQAKTISIMAFLIFLSSIVVYAVVTR
jgi:hypothetical protein